MSIFWKIFIGCLFAVIVIPQMAYAQAIAVPTPHCLGSCPISPTKAAPSTAVSQQPSSPSVAQTSPAVSSAPNISAAPGVSPCSSSTTNSVKSINKSNTSVMKQHPKIGGGVLQQLLQFLIQLIQLLLQQIGVQVPSLPGTGNPCPTPSTGTGGGGGNAPSTAPSSSQPTSGVAPTAGGGGTAPTAGPVTVSSCTNPKYTIQMDPNNAQNGVTIGNYYLTADTWNAANYQLSQTVYGCDYNNWYVVANMNNNSGDGAVKTSPNVHEDINKPLSSFKTISSTFAESGPHVGIYEYEYDLWLNGFDNGSTEVMIWVDNFGQTPSGSKQGTFTDGGHTYDVYSDGSGYVAFVAQSNFTSGTINILDFFNYVTSKGWAATSSTVSQLDFGVELVSTNNAPATFKVTNFSITTN